MQAKYLLVVLGATLVLAYAVDVWWRWRDTQKVPIHRLQYLTHWNYALVTGLLLASPFLTPGVRLGAAVAVSTVSLFVILARLVFLKGETKTSYHVAWDALTHVVVPLIPVIVLVFTKHSPVTQFFPAMLGFGVLELWIIVNVVVSLIREDRPWVYAKAANPFTQSGRFQLLGAVMVAALCVGISIGIARVCGVKQ